jgi:hypothetical protein
VASGLSLEGDLRSFWRDLGCNVRYSEDADLYGKTDAIIDRIGSKSTGTIVVQITTNIDNPVKQKGFETFFWDQKDKHAVYLEIDPLAFERINLGSEDGYEREYRLAKKTVEIFLKLEKISREIGSHLVCLRVNKDLSCRCFDLSIRWRQVASWRARQLSSPRRKRGIITEFWNGSYGIIKSVSGGKEEARRIYINNICDSRLRARLVAGKDNGKLSEVRPLSGRMNVSVTFLPAELDDGPPEVGPVKYDYATALAVTAI